MQTRVQLRVLYGESAQYKLGQGRGRFDDKATRVGPAYQAVIPSLEKGVKTASYNFAAQYCSSQDFLRATAMTREEAPTSPPLLHLPTRSSRSCTTTRTSSCFLRSKSQLNTKTTDVIINFRAAYFQHCCMTTGDVPLRKMASR